MSRTLAPGRYLGDRQSSYSDANCYIEESAYRDGDRLPVHDHAAPHICYVLSGRYSERFGRAWVDRQPFDLLYHPAHVAHAERHHGPGRHLLVEIDPRVLRRCAEAGSLPADPVRFRSRSSSRIVGRIRDELKNRDSFASLVVEGLLLELVAEIGRAPGPGRRSRPPWLPRVVECLREDLGSPPSLAHLAGVAGVHPTHLARAFRRTEGCSVGEYARRLRVARARRLIAGTDRPLAEIALECGFYDQSHLNRVMKRYVGMTPGEYRSDAEREPRPTR